MWKKTPSMDQIRWRVRKKKLCFSSTPTRSTQGPCSSCPLLDFFCDPVFEVSGHFGILFLQPEFELQCRKKQLHFVGCRFFHAGVPDKGAGVDLDDPCADEPQVAVQEVPVGKP